MRLNGGWSVIWPENQCRGGLWSRRLPLPTSRVYHVPLNCGQGSRLMRGRHGCGIFASYPSSQILEIPSFPHQNSLQLDTDSLASMCVLSHLSCVRLSVTPWTMAPHQASLSMGSSRQEHWSGLPFPSPVIKYEVSEVSKMKLLSRVWLFVTPWTVAYQAPPSREFSRQEYWSRLPFPSPLASTEPPNESPRSMTIYVTTLLSNLQCLPIASAKIFQTSLVIRISQWNIRTFPWEF